jgi:hypothetical protein
MITKRQRKKRGKKSKKRVIQPRRRGFGFEKGKWVQVYAQKERVVY